MTQFEKRCEERRKRFEDRIERRQGMKGFGGTPEVPELTKPDFHFATMKAFADAAVGS